MDKDRPDSKNPLISPPTEPKPFEPVLEPTEFQPQEFEPPSDPFATDTSQFSPDIAPDSSILWNTPTEEDNTGPDWTYRILFSLMMLTLVCTIVLCVFAVQQHDANAKNELDSATEKASTLVNLLELDFLMPAESLVSDMRDLIQHDEHDIERLYTFARSNKYQLELLSFGVAYKPFGYNDTTPLKAPFYELRENGQYRLSETSDFYDYTRKPGPGEDFDSRWFIDGFENDGGWQEPYYGHILQDWLAEYSLPIFKTNPSTGRKEKVGIIFADFALEEVREMVHKITLNNLAYGYLVSPQGLLVSHPAEYLLGKPLLSAYNPKIADLETVAADGHLNGQHIAERVANGESFVDEFIDEATGQTSLVVHQKVPRSNWSFGIVTPKEGVYHLAPELKNSILYAVIAVAFTILLSLAVTRYGDFQEDQLPWLLSMLTSLAATGITILILALFWDETTSTQNTKFFSVAEIASARGSPDAKATLIPTGILVNQIEFPQPETAAVSGVIWQKFALNNAKTNRRKIAPKSTAPGIVWPGAKLGTQKMLPLREYEADGFHIRSWRFNVEVPLDRNIRKFPFDMSEIKLSMRAMPGNNALLVPDFESYDFLIPEVKPGVDENINLTYWNIRSSFFSVYNNVKQKLSGTQIEDANIRSEMTFRIQMARLSHVTLISYFLPIFIGSIMMFVVLMIPSDRSPNAVFSNLSYGGTIFFVISIFHVNLRNAEGIDTFTYMESYYIMQHILVMLISLNGFFLMRGSTPRWLHVRNNLLPKLLYWPCLSIFLACSTTTYFL